MIKVSLIYRYPNPLYFSIENVFKIISDTLIFKIYFEEVFAPEQKVSFWGILRNIIFFRKQTADIFHITGDIHYAALGLPSSRTILTIHDCIFLQHPSSLKRWVLKKLWLEWPVKHSAVITTISEATKKDIIKNTGCSPDKVLVIPDPMDVKFKYYPKEFNKDKPAILQVGTWPNKNLERVIPALKDIQCHLYIIGKLSEDQTRQLEINHIEYTNGFKLSQEEIIEWYKKTDIVIFASLFEGFGLPILEAQATGRPVITSNISPMKEVAGDGACLVDPLSVHEIRQAVLKICGSDFIRKEHIERGLLNVKRYDVKVIAEQYLRLYKEIYNKI
jgi:glycosyltransferase involved in cell wall biosynthesis